MTETCTENLNLPDLISSLKTTVSALECQQKCELQKKQPSTKKQPQKRYSFNENKQKYLAKSESKEKYLIKDGSRISLVNNGIKEKRGTKDSSKERVKIKKPSKKKLDEEEDDCAFINPEMRGGIIFTRCDCLMRNGLQDDCPLTLCQGQSDCLIKPWPECPPAKYYRSRHPEIYPTPN